MRQEIFCYIKGKEHVHFLNIEGSLEAHDILAEFVYQIAALSESTPKEVMHTLSGKLQVLINQEALV